MKWPKTKLLTWLVFLVLGIVVSTTCFVTQYYWMDIARFATRDSRLIFDGQPEWMKLLNNATGYISWIVGAIILVLAIIKRKATPIVAYGFGALIPYVCIVGFLFLGPTVDDYSARVVFDSKTWQNPKLAPSVDYVRLRMVDDLQQKYTLIGMSQKAIEILLGPADKTPYFSDWDMVYYLGPERGFMGIDSEWLIIRLNNQGVATEYLIATD